MKLGRVVDLSPSLPGSGGADADFNVDINLDVDEAQAAAEFAKLAKALAAALKSPEVQNSVKSIVTSFQKVFSGTTKTSAQTWKTVQTQGQQAAHNIGKAFDDVARKSKAALSGKPGPRLLERTTSPGTPSLLASPGNLRASGD